LFENLSKQKKTKTTGDQVMTFHTGVFGSTLGGIL